MSNEIANTEKLDDLLRAGQSYWLDNLTRKALETGELKRRVEKEGLRGITSNPKTFSDSVQSGTLYDQGVRDLSEKGDTVEQVYESLMVEDVVKACDALRSVYDESDGLDGFVSIEVDPRLARQTEATLDAARHLWKAVNRPNVMIKIPGTAECLAAIEEALFDGINVNITLLFSVQRYREVAACYIRALDRRRAEGLPVDRIASVASFFLSRIDVMVDDLLGQRSLPACSDGEHIADQLKGKAAIAQAKQAYESFEAIFTGPIWESLLSNGASAQRLLWASTSVKSDDYPDTLYVDSLVAKDTVNTMPESTIEAFADHGSVRANAIKTEGDDPALIKQELEAIGIDLEALSSRLVDEGVSKFIEPFETGLENIREKMEAPSGVHSR